MTIATLATLMALVVLIFAVLLSVAVIPFDHVSVGLLVAALAGAYLVGRL